MLGQKNLLIVAHTPSANTKRLQQAALLGASYADFQVNVQCQTPQQSTPDDVLRADVLLLGTTENFGYMAGLTKDFFERIYYPVLEQKQGMPVAAYIRAGKDGTGTKRAIAGIVTGLRWHWVQEILLLRGDWQEDFVTEVEQMAMTLAAGLDMGMY